MSANQLTTSKCNCMQCDCNVKYNLVAADIPFTCVFCQMGEHAKPQVIAK